MKRQFEFEEVTFADQLIGMKVDVEFTHVPYRPATQWQPEEGGYYEVAQVYTTSVETDTETIKRPVPKPVTTWWQVIKLIGSWVVSKTARRNTLDWCQLDGIAADRLDALMEQYERDF